MMNAMARMAVALSLATLVAASPARAAGLPSWLSIADTRKAPLQAIPAITADRLAALTTEKQPWVERLRRIEHDLRADGTVETRIVHARQLLNEEGVRRGGTLLVSARASTERMFIEEAYVLSHDGRRLPFDTRTLQVIDQNQGELFHDVFDVALPFAKLEAGSTVVVVTRIVRDNRRWPLPWSGIHPTQSWVPTERLELEVRWAAGRSPPAWRTDDAKLICEAGARRVTCARNAIAAIPGDPEVASWADLLPEFVVSDVTSWKALIEIERRLLDPGDTSPEVVNTADRLLQGTSSSAQRTEKILRFVADEIRYVGFEHGRSAVTPHPPALTLARRFGDCKDKVALFLAMARRAGLDAEPVLVATERREPSKLLLPSWKYFDHVIACVRLHPGSEDLMCLDPTVPDLSAGTLPLGVRNAVTLPLATSTGPGRLPLRNGVYDYGWQIEVETLNEVNCDGSTKEVVVRRYRGAGAAAMRGRLRSQNAEDRARWLEDSYSNVMGRKIKPKVSAEGLDAPTAPIELRSVAHFPGSQPLTEHKEWNDGDPWLVNIGNDFRTNNQHHPYLLSGLSLTSKTTYEFCSAMSPHLLGAEIGFESEFGRLTRDYTVTGTRGVVVTVLMIPPQSVPSTQLARFNRFIDTVLGHTRIWFGLKSARSGKK